MKQCSLVQVPLCCFTEGGADYTSGFGDSWTD